jgi:hypothetical protein
LCIAMDGGVSSPAAVRSLSPRSGSDIDTAAGATERKRRQRRPTPLGVAARAAKRLSRRQRRWPLLSRDRESEQRRCREVKAAVAWLQPGAVRVGRSRGCSGCRDAPTAGAWARLRSCPLSRRSGSQPEEAAGCRNSTGARARSGPDLVSVDEIAYSAIKRSSLTTTSSRQRWFCPLQRLPPRQPRRRRRPPAERSEHGPRG